jgi:hypothetical protein
MAFVFRRQTIIVVAGSANTIWVLRSMNHQIQPRAVIGVVAVVSMALFLSTRVPAQDAADLAEGMRLFQQKGDCQACHGWAGDGRKMDSQMPDGADLRALQMDRQTLITTIKCGRPGTGMPAFDKFAYSDGRCFGLKQADLRTRGLPMGDAPATLTPNEISLLADFLIAKIVGKGPLSRAQCIEFWGRAVDACNELKE